MKKKGFTLIELLAVIVILAIIALISVPMIINVIEKAKEGALKDSSYGLIDAANLYYSTNTDSINNYELFEIENGNQISTNKLSFKGQVETGKVYLYATGKIALCIDNGTYYAKQGVNDIEVTTGTGTCGELSDGDFIIISDITTLQEEVTSLQSEINDAKSNLSDILIAKGITASDTEELNSLISKVGDISGDITYDTLSFDHSIPVGTSPTFTDTFNLDAGKYYVAVSSMCYISNEYHTTSQSLTASSGTITLLTSRIPRYYEDITNYYLIELTETTTFTLTVKYTYVTASYTRDSNSYLFITKLA